jgi:hypothetical protein
MVISRNNWSMTSHKAGARLDFDLDEIFADMAVATTPGPAGRHGSGREEGCARRH